MAKKLNAKQQSFIDHYVELKNATEAAKRAGYSKKTAGAKGHDLLKNIEIKAQIDKRLQELSIKTNITAERILEEYARIAFANSGDFFTWTEGAVELVPSDDLTDEQKAAVAEVSQTVTENGGSIKLKLHDKLKALEALAKHLNLFTGEDNAGVGDITIVFEEYTDKEIEAAAQNRPETD